METFHTSLEIWKVILYNLLNTIIGIPPAMLAGSDISFIARTAKATECIVVTEYRLYYVMTIAEKSLKYDNLEYKKNSVQIILFKFT